MTLPLSSRAMFGIDTSNDIVIENITLWNPSAQMSTNGQSETLRSEGGNRIIVRNATVKGLQHTILDTGHVGHAQPIEAYLGADVAAVKVSIMYRPEHATDFSEAKMVKQGACKYVGQIPATAMKGGLVH